MSQRISNPIFENIKQFLIDFNEAEEEESNEEGVFIVKKANDAMNDSSRKTNPRNLWKTLWYEGEICCLFSDSNLGKSIYAVQIATEIAKTEKVLYFDFELSEKQFQLRYTNDKTQELFIFPTNLYRVEINCNKLDPMSFEDNVMDDILNLSINRGCKILIIDNLTYLCSAMEKAEAAGTLMKELISMKKLHGFSIMILAHTPKRPLWEPLNQNHLQGSKRLYNMFDSCFAIGQSAKNEELRYIKELKVRWGSKTYGESHVIVAKIDKIDNFLQFVEVGFAHEKEHLRANDSETREELKKMIDQLKAEGASYRKIGEQLGIPKSTVEHIHKNQK